VSSLLNRAVAFSARYERPIALIGGVWFAASCAQYAGFVDLPEIPLLTGMTAIYASAAANALWWGYLRPAIERRRQALVARNVAVAEYDR
jgi:hypothetical protein